MKEYLESKDEVLASLGTDENGLSDGEAAARREKYGPNKLAEGKKTSLLMKFLGELADPMIIILIAAAVISAFTSIHAHEFPSDVIIILAVVLINAVLGVFQESKAEKAIEALQEIAAATSQVVRAGKQLTVHSEELVPGDIIILEAGNAVPADARIIECASLKAEESALTGESVPVNKQLDALDLGDRKDVPLGDRRNMVYMGSTIVYGRGAAVVTATGMNTEMGKIADAIATAKDDETPLQKKLNQLSKILSILVIAICVVIFGVSLLRSRLSGTEMNLLDTFMVAVSLAVAAIPEGLAAVVTIVLSIGVTNMSHRSAVIRKLTAVETLGCTQVICSDKTGTLTQNRMTVVEHRSDDEETLILGMALCSDAKIDETAAGEDGRNYTVIGEPTEAALADDCYVSSLHGKAGEFVRIGEAPFDSMRKMMSVVCRSSDGGIIQFTKGAPDVVMSRCMTAVIDGKEVPMTDRLRSQLLAGNKAMADRALRVLCCAKRVWDGEPDSYEADFLEQELCYVGLSGMIDPIRPEVKAAIEECRSAGIRPIMITGDHRDTAVAIAKELGILRRGQLAITGAELNDISDSKLKKNIHRYSVYARVQPEHKVRIVNAWKARGSITAMTGDGVNDAPSIKSADIGVGMGITGTDVTKNVADMVLADDNFATIVAAVEEGRRIYDNIRKAIQFLLSSNLAEVLAIFVSTLLGFTILEPVQLLWINLITDCFPALALGMERGESNIMRRAPRSSDDGIFSNGMGFDIAFQGILVTAITMLSYFVGHHTVSGVWGIPSELDRTGITMAFLTLSLVEIFHAFNMRSRRGSIFTIKWQNLWLWGAAAVSFVLTVAVLYVPFLRKAFDFAEISAAQFGIACGLALTIIPIMEIVKLIQRAAEKD